jgi:hypothetical protein
MITRSTLNKVIKLSEISVIEPPSSRIFEFDDPNIIIGKITGKPRITIITPALLVLDESAEIMVKADEIPKQPRRRLTQNQN